MIGAATINLRQRTIGPRLGLTQSLFSVKGAKTVSAGLCRRADTVVYVKADGLSIMNETGFTPLPASDYFDHLKAAGVRIMTFTSDIEPAEALTVLNTLSGRSKISDRVTITDAQGNVVPAATWTNFYPDLAKLTLLERMGPRGKQILFESACSRDLRNILETPGGELYEFIDRARYEDQHAVRPGDPQREPLVQVVLNWIGQFKPALEQLCDPIRCFEFNRR